MVSVFKVAITAVLPLLLIAGCGQVQRLTMRTTPAESSESAASHESTSSTGTTTRSDAPARRTSSDRSESNGAEVRAVVSLVNDSSAPIHEIYMSSSEQTAWGSELLNGRVLGPDQALELPEIVPGVWDIRVVDRDGLWKEFYNQQVSADGNHRLVITSDEWNQSFR